MSTIAMVAMTVRLMVRSSSSGLPDPLQMRKRREPGVTQGKEMVKLYTDQHSFMLFRTLRPTPRSSQTPPPYPS